MTLDYPRIRKAQAIKLAGTGAALGRLLGCNRHNVSQMGTYLIEKHARRLVVVLPAAKQIDERNKRAKSKRAVKRTPAVQKCK